MKNAPALPLGLARTRSWSQYPGLPVFTAPALPRGSDFTGLVELHGTIQGVITDMVVTDRDFGRAYMTEGWARIFLEQMLRATRFSLSATASPTHQSTT